MLIKLEQLEEVLVQLTRIKLGEGNTFWDLIDEKILNDKIKNILDYHNIILAGLNSQPKI